MNEAQYEAAGHPRQSLIAAIWNTGGHYSPKAVRNVISVANRAAAIDAPKADVEAGRGQ